MRRLSVLIGLVLLVVLAACANQPAVEEIAPTVEAAIEAVPTAEAPTAETMPEPTASYVESLSHTADPLLIDKVWAWERRDPNGNDIPEIVVPNPENYTITFNEDGTFNAVVDCNVAGGAYATTPPSAIFMELGPMTMMACPPDSLADQMMQLFGPAQTYRFEEDGSVLRFDWAAGGPIDYYRLSDGEMGDSTETAAPSLTGVVWEWSGTITPVDTVAVADPSRYTILFNEDGTANIQADCNVVLAQYVAEGNSLSLTLGPSTLVACGPDSQDQVFLQQLGAAALTFFEEGDLYIDLAVDSGTMRFVAQPEPALTGTTWQWLGTTTPVEMVAVADPSRYTITFNDDGTASVVADCNTAVLQYTTDGSAMTINAGAMSLVACPEDSQDVLFLQQLSAAAIYFFDGGDLYIDLVADSGTMHFAPLPEVDLPAPEQGAPTGVVNAPDGIFLRSGPGTNYPAVGTAPLGDSGLLVGISEDGLWYVVEAPDLPGGQVWVAAEFVDATNADGLPVVAAPALPSSLTGITWNWISLTTPVAETQIADPSRYTINFAADGSATIQADCNVVLAQYIVDGSRITIIPGPTTLAACPPDSQDQLFVQSLTGAAIYFFDGGDLFLDLMADAGTMRFSPAGAVAVPGEPTVSGGAAGVTFRVASFGPAGAPVPLIAGSTITALFDDTAATVSGSGGCNNYTGTLIPADGFFTVGPIASTLMLCESPAGVMEQESAFLAALGGTNGYQWEQQRVESGTVVTAGQLFYALADGTTGVINLVSP